MAFASDELLVTHQLILGDGYPSCLGIDQTRIRGSSFEEGPKIIGDPNTWSSVSATLMVGQCTNIDLLYEPTYPVTFTFCGTPIINSPYSLAVDGSSLFIGNVDIQNSLFVNNSIKVNRSVEAEKDVTAQCGKHQLSKKKDFDIPHPNKEGWRLTHACLEGPEAAVYKRGRVKNKYEIPIPEYWNGLVDLDTLSVLIQPIGSHQDIIVKGWNKEKIILQSKGNMPIDCFYHLYCERIDTEKLIPEYEGSIEDYPGDNNQRSIVGYNYDN